MSKLSNNKALGDKYQVIIGDSRQKLKELPSSCVHTVVTSPPYFQLRDYGVDGQIGLEKTIPEFLEVMTEIFNEVYRVLRPDGTLWLNMGDTYKDGRQLGIPWRLALALQDQGWYLRSDIIWEKPNAIPEPDRKRPSKSHEYIFLFSKGSKYFYDTDAIRTPSHKVVSINDYIDNLGSNTGAHSLRWSAGYKKCSHAATHPVGANKRTVWKVATQPRKDAHFATYPEKLIEPCILAGTSAFGACPLCNAPWSRISEYSQAYKDRLGKSWNDHKNDSMQGQRGCPSFTRDMVRYTIGWEATCKCSMASLMPLKPCTVLDPFAGSGTTGIVAMKNGRNVILIEINPEYGQFIEKNLSEVDVITHDRQLKILS